MHSFDAIAGSLLGGAFGDSYGAQYEGQPQPGVEAYDPASAFITDDTQLTLATCEAIIESAGSVVPKRIAAAFLHRFRSGHLVGLGASTAKALQALEAGAHWAIAGRQGEFAAGNGAAMRIAPLAFVLDPLADDARVHIRDVSRITHRNDEAYVGALAVAIAIHHGLSKQPVAGLLDTVADNLPDTATCDQLRKLIAENPPTLSDAATLVGNSGYVAESVPLAIHAASKITASSFTADIAALISCGGDTDTIASIAGQVAGARIGISALPSQVASVPDAEHIRDVSKRLSALASPEG